MSQLLKDQLNMIQEFQCPGCGLGGPDPKECSSFLLEEDLWQEKVPNFHCKNHSAGTFMGRVGYIYLGLPKGFNKVGCIQPQFKLVKRSNNIYLFLEQVPKYNNCNVPVWAMIKDGYLFVRVYMPRINSSIIQVIKYPYSIELPKGSLDVSTFYDEID